MTGRADAIGLSDGVERTCSPCCGFFRSVTGTRTRRSLPHGTNSASFSGNLAADVSGSARPSGRCWRRCCNRCRGRRCAGCGCWYAQTRSCAGTGTCSLDSTPHDRGRNVRGGHRPYGRSVPWSCGWSPRIPDGDTAACTGNCWSWASRSPRRPCGRSSNRPASTPHDRASSTWAQFLRSQADALLACDFF